MDVQKPITVSFVSGKGGVGKTMLATAFARELSKSSRTLLIDFDFFNRGLTGLLPRGRQICSIPRPDFLRAEDEIQNDWAVIEIDDSLCSFAYPDLTELDMKKFATAPIQELSSSFEKFLLEAARASGCQAIVIDCHGGPDNSSFAAAIVSDHTLIITEPDRITLHGTLNFVRQLCKSASTRATHLHVVFNKVVTQFSGLFLKRLYDRRIKKEMKGAELLAIVPLELYLTKEFEKTSFLTDAYPYSLLAKKIRLIVNRLFPMEHRNLPQINRSRMSAFIGYIRTISTGRVPWFADKDVVMALIASLVVFGIILTEQWGSESFANYRTSDAIRNLSTIRSLIKSVDSDSLAMYWQYSDSMARALGDPVAAADLSEALFRIEYYGGLFLEHYYRSPSDFWYGEDIAVMAQDFVRWADSVPTWPTRYLDTVVYAEIKYLKEFPEGDAGLLKQLARSVNKKDEIIVAFLVLWYVAVLVYSWHIVVDRRVTYHARLKHSTKLAGSMIVLLVLWFLPLCAVAAAISGAQYNKWGADSFLAVTPAFVLFTTTILNQFWRIRGLKLTREWRELCVRALLVSYLIGGPFVFIETHILELFGS
ncbi:MAG TPA: ParA family protein [Candidatus Deferrimicrobium sp.]|nr:ParA family protein [Candidatus Deferrimicrobium sp.]